MRRYSLLAAALFAAGCQGTVPPTKGDGRLGYGAVLVRGHVVTPAGETMRARLALNIESDEQRFILPFTPDQTSLYVVPPGVYRLMPLRGSFGVTERSLALIIENRVFRTPFPRDILRKDSFEVRSNHIVPIGVLEVEASRDPADRRIHTKVTLDDSKAARRQLIQDKISNMLDPRVAPAVRDSAIQWTKALDQALVQVEADPDIRAPFKPRLK